MVSVSNASPSSTSSLVGDDLGDGGRDDGLVVAHANCGEIGAHVTQPIDLVPRDPGVDGLADAERPVAEVLLDDPQLRTRHTTNPNHLIGRW